MVLKPIEGFPAYYVSKSGQVWSTNQNKFLGQQQNAKGYLMVRLYNQAAWKWKLIHRLVAFAYVPNPFNKAQVNHEDENILNNNESNLEWVTNLENQQHRARCLNERLRNDPSVPF